MLPAETHLGGTFSVPLPCLQSVPGLVLRDSKETSGTSLQLAHPYHFLMWFSKAKSLSPAWCCCSPFLPIAAVRVPARFLSLPSCGLGLICCTCLRFTLIPYVFSSRNCELCGFPPPKSLIPGTVKPVPIKTQVWLSFCNTLILHQETVTCSFLLKCWERLCWSETSFISLS